MNRKVGRPVGQFDAKKDKLLFLLQKAPELRKATNKKLGELLNVGPKQVSKYLKVLEKENKISQVKKILSFSPTFGNGVCTIREIFVITEEVNAIF